MSSDPPQSDRDYDLAVVGGGSAGLTAARFAARLGARVALVEKDRIGGDCTWTGCVPSKTLLKAARVAQEMRTADRYGLRATEPVVDLKRVMDHVRTVIAQVYEAEAPEALQAEGIGVFLGPARFNDPFTLTVADTTLRARRIVLATGARPFVPPVSGLDTTPYLTNESVWDQQALPQRLLVVGAGPVGCELAQAFRRLGTRVTLIDMAEGLLPLEEVDASRVLARRFADESVDLRLSATLQKVWQEGGDVHLLAGGEELVGDALLLALGRRPVVEGLGLEQAGVTFDGKGIQVDGKLRTSQKHIYAAGDCIGGYQFTHYAGWQGFVAARNALLPGVTRGVGSILPWATFTDPEVAHVGLTEAEAREQMGEGVRTAAWPMAQVDRALVESDADGFLKVVYNKNGTLLGVTIVAGRAGEMLHEWILAMDRGLKLGDIAGSLHIYPTYSMGSLQASAEVRMEQLLSGISGRVVRRLVRRKWQKR